MVTYLFKDEEVEEDHAEIVNNEGFAELEGLSVLHVFGPQPEEQQVGGTDGQRGQGVVHQRPFLHPLVCRIDILIALHNYSLMLALHWHSVSLIKFKGEGRSKQLMSTDVCR